MASPPSEAESTISRSRLTMALGIEGSDVNRSHFCPAGVEGTWNGDSARIRRIARQKSVLARIVASVRLQAPARIIITRRQHGIFAGRPPAWFGPSMVVLPL